MTLMLFLLLVSLPLAAAVADARAVSVLCDSTSSIARMTHIEAGRTIMLAVNRFDVRYHIIYVAFL